MIGKKGFQNWLGFGCMTSTAYQDYGNDIYDHFPPMDFQKTMSESRP